MSDPTMWRVLRSSLFLITWLGLAACDVTGTSRTLDAGLVTQTDAGGALASAEAGAVEHDAAIRSSSSDGIGAVDSGHDESELEYVSLIELLGAPERFRDHRVRLVGYVNLEFEGNAVYLHKEDFENALTKNALWLDLGDTRVDPKFLKSGVHGYCVVEGEFWPDSHGHFSSFGGAIGKITRLAPGLGAQMRAGKY